MTGSDPVETVLLVGRRGPGGCRGIEVGRPRYRQDPDNVTTDDTAGHPPEYAKFRAADEWRTEDILRAVPRYNLWPSRDAGRWPAVPS